jgi:hypothetical protein
LKPQASIWNRFLQQNLLSFKVTTKVAVQFSVFNAAAGCIIGNTMILVSSQPFVAEQLMDEKLTTAFKVRDLTGAIVHPPLNDERRKRVE